MSFNDISCNSSSKLSAFVEEEGSSIRERTYPGCRCLAAKRVGAIHQSPLGAMWRKRRSGSGVREAIADEEVVVEETEGMGVLVDGKVD